MNTPEQVLTIGVYTTRITNLSMRLLHTRLWRPCLKPSLKKLYGAFQAQADVVGAQSYTFQDILHFQKSANLTSSISQSGSATLNYNLNLLTMKAYAVFFLRFDRKENDISEQMFLFDQPIYVMQRRYKTGVISNIGSIIT